MSIKKKTEATRAHELSLEVKHGQIVEACESTLLKGKPEGQYFLYRSLQLQELPKRTVISWAYLIWIIAMVLEQRLNTGDEMNWGSFVNRGKYLGEFKPPGKGPTLNHQQQQRRSTRSQRKRELELRSERVKLYGDILGKDIASLEVREGGWPLEIREKVTSGSLDFPKPYRWFEEGIHGRLLREIVLRGKSQRTSAKVEDKTTGRWFEGTERAPLEMHRNISLAKNTPVKNIV